MPPLPASASSAATYISTPAFCFAANSRTSSVIFIEQKLSSLRSFASAALRPRPGAAHRAEVRGIGAFRRPFDKLRMSGRLVMVLLGGVGVE